MNKVFVDWQCEKDPCHLLDRSRPFSCTFIFCNYYLALSLLFFCNLQLGFILKRHAKMNWWVSWPLKCKMFSQKDFSSLQNSIRFQNFNAFFKCFKLTINWGKIIEHVFGFDREKRWYNAKILQITRPLMATWDRS